MTSHLKLKLQKCTVRTLFFFILSCHRVFVDLLLKHCGGLVSSDQVKSLIQTVSVVADGRVVNPVRQKYDNVVPTG